MVKIVTQIENRLGLAGQISPSVEILEPLESITSPTLTHEEEVPSYLTEAVIPVRDAEGKTILVTVGQWLSMYPPSRGGT